MAGRKCKLTEELTNTICENIELGLSYNLTCQAAGITFETFNDWMKKGASGDKKFTEFYERVQASEAECARQCLERIRDAAESGTWAADAWLLERRYHADYGKKDSVNMRAKTESVNYNVELQEADTIRSEILRRLSFEADPEC